MLDLFLDDVRDTESLEFDPELYDFIVKSTVYKKVGLHEFQFLNADQAEIIILIGALLL